MRIIGGRLGGRRLFSVKGTDTRPTSDPLREAVFNILSGLVEGAVVLDLFAGTGALGLEALSRGADSAVFVDHDRRAAAVIRRNLEACGLTGRSRVIRWDAAQSLRPLASQPVPFSLIFMDPPYGGGLAAPALTHLHHVGRVADGAVVVVEHTAGEPMDAPPVFVAKDRRRYGKTFVTFFRYGMEGGRTERG